MRKSGLADSPFFSTPAKPDLPSAQASVQVSTKRSMPPFKNKNEKLQDATQPIKPDTTISSNHDTLIPRYHDIMIERVRKAVRNLGKEAATHRFTTEEKKLIADIIYVYKNIGIKTSENEITRIAINYILEDYRENGKNSLLEKALRALNE